MVARALNPYAIFGNTLTIKAYEAGQAATPSPCTCANAPAILAYFAARALNPCAIFEYTFAILAYLAVGAGNPGAIYWIAPSLDTTFVRRALHACA